MKNYFFKIYKNNYWRWFFLAFVLEVGSFAAYLNNGLMNILSGTLVLLFIYLCIKDLKWGMLVIFMELILGVYGYLYTFDVYGFILPLRYVFFIIWLAIWLVKIVNDEREKFFSAWRRQRSFVFGILFLIFSGIFLGILNNNSYANIFFDSNAWFYWIYLLPFSMYTLPRKQIWPLFVSAVSWIAFKTVVYEYIFAHKFDSLQWWLYHWQRDFRLLEITPITGSLSRVFSQSQIFLIIIFILVVFYLFYKRKNINYSWIVFGSVYLAAIFISYSRSFWLGISAGLVIWIFMHFIKKYYLVYPFDWRRHLAQPLIVFCLGIGLVFAVLNFPYPERIKTSINSVFSARFSGGLEEPAANARINMLKPLFDGIKTHWFLGSGFGTTITYNSTDPRILSATPGQSGLFTTYAFEWGYFDIWLKVGVLGLVIYLTVLLKFLYSLLRDAFMKKSWFLIGLGISFVALFILNTTTPYLNHPLGIGYVLLILSLQKSYQNYDGDFF